jgi:hypothetical protein
MMCRDCGFDIEKPKKWGYATVCDACDVALFEAQHVGVIVADGKTDYGIQLVRNPTKSQAEKIRSLGLAHDPRTQMRFTGKGQHNEREEK